MAHTNFAQWLFDQNVMHPDKTAVIDPNGSITYRELEYQARCFATRLYQQGLGPEQRIIIQLRDSCEWPVAFLGCILLGTNPVLASPDLHTNSLIELIATTNAKAIIIDDLDTMDYGIITVTKADIVRGNTEWHDDYQYHPDEPCLWLMSSGTTGTSKCIVHRHAALELLHYAVAASGLQLDTSSRVYCTGKLSWTYGLNCTITHAMGMGATVYVMPGTPAPSRIYQACDDHNITHLLTVPSVLAAMLRHPGQISDSVQHVFTSGEPLSDTIGSAFYDAYGYRLIDVIGQSETAQIYAVEMLPVSNQPGHRYHLPGITCEVRNTEGNPVPHGELGELWVNSPCAALGYYKDWQNTKNTFVGNWVRTGDMMTVNSEGIYQYHGRNDDLIKIKGLWVSHVEVEQAINEHPGVTDCAVVMRPNRQGLNEIHAFIVSNDPVNNLREFLSNNLSKHKLPQHIHWVKELPKTVTAKIRRRALREMDIVVE